MNLRLFADENGRAWSKNVMDLDYEVLCVSQFTLQCILKGNKPDFHMAMPAELAGPFYNNILENMRSIYKPEHIKGGLVFPHLCNLHPSPEVPYRERSLLHNTQSLVIGSRLLDIRPGHFCFPTSASFLFRFLTYLTSILNLVIALNFIGRFLQLIVRMKELSILFAVAVNWVTPPGRKCGDNLVPMREE